MQGEGVCRDRPIPSTVKGIPRADPHNIKKNGTQRSEGEFKYQQPAVIFNSIKKIM